MAFRHAVYLSSNSSIEATPAFTICRSQGGPNGLPDYSEPSHHGQDSDRSRTRLRQSTRNRSQHANRARIQSEPAARATSSDLAAAEALAELRRENDPESDDHSEMGCEEVCGDSPRSGGVGYDGIFRVTKPPLPLWVAGTPLYFYVISITGLTHLTSVSAALVVCRGYLRA